MIAKAKVKFVHVSPVKVRQVIDLIRGRDVESSLMILAHTQKKSTVMIQKVLNAAISNAKKKGLMENQLVISKIVADKGPMWKRFKAAAFGRASRILKRTTHLTIELDAKTK
ncbi:MAG: 50S ribosomal protein L22 [Candidatus Omnitrophota bacterium]